MQDGHTDRVGQIPVGAIGFLKGAARITTAVAVVAACWKLGLQAGGGPISPENYKKMFVQHKIKCWKAF